MERIVNAVKKNRQLILDSESYLWKNPETGYREWKSSAYMEKVFEDLGYEITKAGNIPGFYTLIDTGREGPTVMILSELDALICGSHPEADPETGAVHACGHCAQGAAMTGIAAALKEPGVLDMFCGKIKLCVVPAEELLEIGYRRELRNKGIIKYFGGKAEFLARGYFDDVDIAFMAHTGGAFGVGAGHVGCIAKEIIYKGKAAHAGGAPWSGNNALYAATCGLNAANALRETFKDSDMIRFHPIITHGGEVVNAIPERVNVESYVRGKTFEAIRKANERINRALCGAALSFGANVEILDVPGYAPENNFLPLAEAARDATAKIFDDVEFKLSTGVSSGSTDMGDLCMVMPVIHPHVGGATGHAHGNDYYISDPEIACVMSAKWQLAVLSELLGNNGERAKSIIEAYEAPFESVKAYTDYLESVFCEGDRITYGEDGTACVNTK